MEKFGCEVAKKKKKKKKKERKEKEKKRKSGQKTQKRRLPQVTLLIFCKQKTKMHKFRIAFLPNACETNLFFSFGLNLVNCLRCEDSFWWWVIGM